MHNTDPTSVRDQSNGRRDNPDDPAQEQVENKSQNKNQNKGRKWGPGIAIATIVFAGFIIMGMGLMARPNVVTSVRISDGRLFLVKKVAYGKIEQMFYARGTFQADTNVTDMPAKAAEGVSLWIDVGQTGYNNIPSLWAVDSHGDLFRNENSTLVVTHPLPFTIPFATSLPFLRPHMVIKLDFTNFPRRDKILHFRLYDHQGKVLGEFSLVNPTPVSPPDWKPVALPATRTDGDLSVMLKRASWWSGGQMSQYGVSISNYPMLQVEYEPRRNGHPDWDWMLTNQELTDVTGNVSLGGTTAWELCPHEAAYKVRLTFELAEHADFSPQETWTLKDVPVPAPGKIKLLQDTTRLAGVKLTPRALAVAPTVQYSTPAPGSPTPVSIQASGTPGKEWNRANSFSTSGTNNNLFIVGTASPQIAVSTEGLRPDQRLTVWATSRDDHGHTARYNQVSYSDLHLLHVAGQPQSGSEHLKVGAIQIPLSAHKVDLHFTIHSVRKVEFIVHPEVRKL